MNVKQSSQVKNSSTQVDFVVMTKAVAKLGQKRINEIAEWANPRGFPLSGALAAELEYLADRARWPREKRPGPGRWWPGSHNAFMDRRSPRPRRTRWAAYRGR